MRCLYLDLDGTLLGRGGSLLHDGDGAFSLLGARALEACARAGVEVVPCSGRARAGLARDARLLGLSSYVFEAGAGFVLDDEVHWLTDVRHADLAPAAARLMEAFPGHLEPHAPWNAGREVSHLLRGRVDLSGAATLLGADVRLVDNGPVHPSRMPGVPDPRAYHLLPVGVGKPPAVAAHARARGHDRAALVAVGDSREDLDVASVVGAFWLVANSAHASAPPAGVRVAAGAHGAGVYEAVVTTLAERR